MRILIICQYYRPDITAAANRLSDTADLLVARGHQVTVVTSTPHKAHIFDTEDFDKASPADIHRVDVAALRTGTSSLYIRQYLGFSLAAFRVAHRLKHTKSFDVIWVSSPPLPVAIASILLRAVSRIPVVFDVRDIWPESAVNIGKVRRGSMTERLGKILEWAAYAHAREITCVSKNMKTYISGVSKRPISVIYNGIPRAEIASADLEKTDPDTFCYAGNIGHAQDLVVVVQGFSEALSDPVMAKARLSIIGDGAARGEIEQRVADLGIQDRVIFTGALPKSDAIARMKRSGTLLIPLKDSPAFNLTVPSKIFDCLALGRPIVANVVGEGREILKRTGANIVVPPSSVRAIAKALVLARSEWPQRAEKARENILLVAAEFSREKAVDLLEGVLERARR